MEHESLKAGEPGAALWPFAAAAAILILPLWLVDMPAMPDYPAHLASFWLIGGGNAARFYHVAWSFVPNIGSEVLVPLLASVTGLTAAAKLFLSAAIALWIAGPALIHRALYGRLGLGPLLAAPFAYNANFMWSFFNYYFAAGLCFLVFAAWIRVRGRWTAARVGGFALAVTLVYFCHIFAAAVLLPMLACHEMARHGRDRRALARGAGIIAAVYAPAALAFLLLKPRGGDEGNLAFNFADTWRDRLESVLQHHFDSPAHWMPLLLLAALGLALALRRARLHPLALPVLAVLLAGSVLAPEFAFGGWGVDLRVPALLASLLFAASSFRLPARAARLAPLLPLALMAWYAAGLTNDWRRYDRQFREFRAAIAGLPRGSRIFTVLDGDSLGDAPEQLYWHMAEYAVMDRGDFTALMFATSGQHVVRLDPRVASFAARTAAEGSPPDVGDLDQLSAGRLNGDPRLRDLSYLSHFQCHFDAAVVIDPQGARQPLPATLRLRHAGSFFTLDDVKPDSSCAR